MWKPLMSVLTILLAAGLAWAKHGPMEMNQKVGSSDLIVIGTVTEMRLIEEKVTLNESAQDHAHAVAVVRVEKVVKGAEDVKQVEVGFRFDYACECIRFELGERCVLFLHKTSLSYEAPVNWEYGVKEIKDGQVDDVTVRWPEKKTTVDEAVAAIQAEIARQANEKK